MRSTCGENTIKVQDFQILLQISTDLIDKN